MRALVLNGPNLNLLGTRRPETYGETTLPELERLAGEWGAGLGMDVECFQSNGEGALIDRVHRARGGIDAIVFNPGAYTHTSYALHDAIEAVEIPTVETHISNVMEREPWRSVSLISPACVHRIYGRGIDGYRWALRHLAARTAVPATRISYGEDPEQFLEMRRQDGGAPLAVLVHGGFWRHTWAFDTLDMNAVDLFRRGYHVAGVEYRRVGNGGGWPVTRDDVVEGIRTAIASLPKPPQRIAIIGHSAGGQLALQAAAELDDTRPVTAVSMGGVNDMVAAAETGIGDDAAAGYLGGADPRDASPLEHPPEARVIVAHGTDDDRVPVHHARIYAETHDATILETEGGGHFEFLDTEHPMWSTIVDHLA